MLLPKVEIFSIPWVALLPTELGVLSIFTQFEVHHAEVFVKLLLVLSTDPVEMQAESLCVTMGYCGLSEGEIWEVVLHAVCFEKGLTDRIVEVFIVLMLPLSLSVVRSHDEHISFFVMRGHHPERHLNLREFIHNG